VVPGSAPAKDWTNIHFSSPTRSADVPLGVRYGTVKLGSRAPPNADFRFAPERRYPKDRSQCPFRASKRHHPASSVPTLSAPMTAVSCDIGSEDGCVVVIRVDLRRALLR
jgi:hypothetical protein